SRRCRETGQRSAGCIRTSACRSPIGAPSACLFTQALESSLDEYHAIVFGNSGARSFVQIGPLPPPVVSPFRCVPTSRVLHGLAQHGRIALANAPPRTQEETVPVRGYPEHEPKRPDPLRLAGLFRLLQGDG